MDDDAKKEIARKKAAALGAKYGGLEGQRVNQHFVYSTLGWLLRFKFTTHEVIAQLFGIKSATARDKLRKMELKKLLKKVPCHTVQSNYIYMITALGVSTLESVAGRKGTPTFNSLRVANKALNVHDLCTQFFCAHLYRTQKYGPIKAMYHGGFFKLQKKLPKIKFALSFNGKNEEKSCIPDAAVEFENGKRAAVEYDSQSKNANQVLLRVIYHSLYMQRDDAFYTQIIYCFRYESSIEKYKKILDSWLGWAVTKDEYYATGDDERNNVVSCRNEPARQAIRERFAFHHIRDLDVFYGGKDLSFITI